MKKKTIIISGIAAVLVIGSVVFCFAVKGDGTQPAEVAQTVTEAVATPSIEVIQETTEEVSEPEEVPEVEVAEEPEVVEETTEVEETSEEVSEDAGVSTQTEEVKPVEPKQEEVKPAETKPVETQPSQQTKPTETKPVETQPQQTTVDAQRDAILAQAYALGATDGIPDSTSVLGDRVSNVGLQWE